MYEYTCVVLVHVITSLIRILTVCYTYHHHFYPYHHCCYILGGETPNAGNMTPGRTPNPYADDESNPWNISSFATASSSHQPSSALGSVHGNGAGGAHRLPSRTPDYSTYPGSSSPWVSESGGAGMTSASPYYPAPSTPSHAASGYTITYNDYVSTSSYTHDLLHIHNIHT